MTDEQHPAIPEPKALEIFDGVRPQLLEGIGRRHYANGDVLLASGSEPDRLIVLAWGHVGIYENGTRIATRSPVRLLGELAFIDERPRSASVIAEGAVITYEFEHDQVVRLMDDVTFQQNLSRELGLKLREATAERAIRYQREERLFGAFRAHVSPEVLNDLLETGDDGRPRQTEVVAIFADIRGFTDKTNVMQPDALFADLAAFYETAIRIVQEHGGMVDKLIGDEVMAVWGYNPRSDHADRAFEAAIALARDARLLSLDGDPLRIGIGVELGICTLGVVGSDGKRSFTAIGPSVNLAARLQAATKELGATICLGPDLVGRLSKANQSVLTGPDSYDIRGVGPIQVWTHEPKE